MRLRVKRRIGGQEMENDKCPQRDDNVCVHVCVCVHVYEVRETAMDGQHAGEGE